MDITGRGFAPGATDEPHPAGTANLRHGHRDGNRRAINCTFDLPVTATTGLWNVVVSNPGGPGGTLTNGFTINPGLAVTAISPNNGVRGDHGRGHRRRHRVVNGATVTLSPAGEPDITASGVAVTSSTGSPAPSCSRPTRPSAPGT